MKWLTNDPEAAKALRKADAQYAKAREAAKALPLAQKAIALREAKGATMIDRAELNAAEAA